MDTESPISTHVSIGNVEKLLALGAGTAVLVYGTTSRARSGRWIAAASLPFFYRGLVGRWPGVGSLRSNGDTKAALGGERGVRVHESVRLECPVAEVYAFWRRLENLPRFMQQLISVREDANGRSHWVASGPGGIRVEWDAELINEQENKLIAWRSLPGSDVVTAGSVTFDTVRDGRQTQLSVSLQYAPPAGKAGAALATLFGREPSQTIRENLRRLKQLLEAGELAQTTPSV